MAKREGFEEKNYQVRHGGEWLNNSLFASDVLFSWLLNDFQVWFTMVANNIFHQKNFTLSPGQCLMCWLFFDVIGVLVFLTLLLFGSWLGQSKD